MEVTTELRDLPGLRITSCNVRCEPGEAGPVLVRRPLDPARSDFAVLFSSVLPRLHHRILLVGPDVFQLPSTPQEDPAGAAALASCFKHHLTPHGVAWTARGERFLPGYARHVRDDWNELHVLVGERFDVGAIHAALHRTGAWGSELWDDLELNALYFQHVDTVFKNVDGLCWSVFSADAELLRMLEESLTLRRDVALERATLRETHALMRTTTSTHPRRFAPRHVQAPAHASQAVSDKLDSSQFT
ncbi:MAG: hypothetical protein AB2A00_17560 [Myxococcota bacterium]